MTVATTDPRTIAAALPYVASPGGNFGNVTAGAFSAATSGSLAAGTAVVPAGYFGQDLTVKFTSATTFNVLSSGNAIIASGSFSAGGLAEVAIAYPSPAPAGEVAVMTLSPGTPATGDTFSLTPGGIASNGNILAMTKLSSQNLLSRQTLTSAYGAGRPGRQRRQAANFAAHGAGVLSQVSRSSSRSPASISTSRLPISSAISRPIRRRRRSSPAPRCCSRAS